MDNIKNIVTGGIITLFIGGTAFTFSQQDVIDNLAGDSGLTQEQAEQYVNNIPEDELVSWSEVGNDLISEGKESAAMASEIDCDTYEYEWESPTLSCSQGKTQLEKIAASEQSLGQAYLKLDSETASREDMENVIEHLDQLNADYDLEISYALYDSVGMEEVKMTNLYNKSVLKAALESN